MNKSRLEAFSDGVLAIVITLLIFEIKVPHVPVNELNKALLGLTPKFLSFALSFAIIGVYWVSHHNMLHFIERTDRGALWLNIFVLFTICIIPFPTGLLGDYPGAKAPVVFYGLTLSLVNIAGTIFWIYCTRNNRLSDQKLNPKFARKVAMLHFSPVILYLLAIAMASVSVNIAYIIFIFVPMFFIIPNVFLNRLFSKPYLD